MPISQERVQNLIAEARKVYFVLELLCKKLESARVTLRQMEDKTPGEPTHTSYAIDKLHELALEFAGLEPTWNLLKEEEHFKKEAKRNARARARAERQRRNEGKQTREEYMLEFSQRHANASAGLVFPGAETSEETRREFGKVIERELNNRPEPTGDKLPTTVKYKLSPYREIEIEGDEDSCEAPVFLPATKPGTVTGT